MSKIDEIMTELDKNAVYRKPLGREKILDWLEKNLTADEELVERIVKQVEVSAGIPIYKTVLKSILRSELLGIEPQQSQLEELREWVDDLRSGGDEPLSWEVIEKIDSILKAKEEPKTIEKTFDVLFRETKEAAGWSEDSLNFAIEDEMTAHFVGRTEALQRLAQGWGVSLVK